MFLNKFEGYVPETQNIRQSLNDKTFEFVGFRYVKLPYVCGKDEQKFEGKCVYHIYIRSVDDSKYDIQFFISKIYERQNCTEECDFAITEVDNFNNMTHSANGEDKLIKICYQPEIIEEEGNDEEVEVSDRFFHYKRTEKKSRITKECETPILYLNKNGCPNMHNFACPWFRFLPFGYNATYPYGKFQISNNDFINLTRTKSAAK
jgi:hypothetical protein